MTISSAQLRMARAALNLGVRELGALADVNPNTISRIENGNDSKSSTLDRLQAVFEERGISFSADGSALSKGGER